jgi:hypothetical protein
LGLTYFRLGNHNTSYNYIQEVCQLFNTLPVGDVESQWLGNLCGIDLVENARSIEKADKVVSLA